MYVLQFPRGPEHQISDLEKSDLSVWRPKKGVNIKEIGVGRLLIQFFHALDLKRVMEVVRGPLGHSR